MKKFFLIFVTTLIVLLTLGIGTGVWFFGNKNLHTKIANSILKKSGASVKCAKFSLQKIEVENIELTSNNVKLTAEFLEFEFSPTHLFFGELRGSGALKKVAITVQNQKPLSNTNSLSESKNASIKKVRSNFSLPINLNIASFKFDGNVSKNSHFATFAGDIKNLKLSKNESLFDIEINLSTQNTTYKTCAKKTKKKFLAKLSRDNDEIFIITGKTTNFKKGSAKAKLTVNSNTFKPIAEILEIKLPNTKAQFFAEGNFDTTANEYSANLIAKSAISDLKEIENFKNAPFDNLKLEFQTDFLVSPKILRVARMESFVSAQDTPILKLKQNTPLEINLEKIGDDAWLDLCEMSVVIPPEFVNNFLTDASLTAENIGGIFKISANKCREIKISTEKPANILNANLVQNKSTIFTDLSLLFEGDALIDTTAHKAKIDAQIKSVKHLDKQFITKIYADGNLEKSICKINVSGSLAPIVSRLNSVSANTNLNIDAKIEIENRGNRIKISSLETAIQEDSTKKALSISSQTPFEFDTKNKTFIGSSELKISACDFPFAPFRTFAPNTDARTISLKTTAKISGQKIDASGDFSVTDISHKIEEQSVFADISASTNFKLNVDLKEKVCAFSCTDTKISDSIATLCVGAASAEFGFGEPIKIHKTDARATLVLPQILRLPVFANYNNLARGSANVNFELKNESDVFVQIKANNVASKTSSNDIDTILAEISTSTKLESIRANLQIVSTRGETDADLSIKKTDKITANLLAKRVVLEDLAILKSVFAPPPKQSFNAQNEQPKKIIPQAKDTKPFWDTSTDIDAIAKISELYLPNGVKIENISSTCVASSQPLHISCLSAQALNGTLSGNLKINFNKDAKNPYEVLPSSLKLENFDIAKTSNREFLSGSFSANIELSGVGDNLKSLTNYLVGRAQIQVRNGRIRLINTDIDLGQKIALAQSATKMFNKFLKNKDVDNSLNIVEKFASLKFDTAKFELSRNSDNFNVNIDFGEINAYDTILKITKGVFYFSPDKPFARQNMEIDIALYINNPIITQVLEKTNALVPNAELRGFRKTEPLKIFGTLEKPKTNLIDIITGSKATSAPIKIFNKLKLFK